MQLGSIFLGCKIVKLNKLLVASNCYIKRTVWKINDSSGFIVSDAKIDLANSSSFARSIRLSVYSRNGGGWRKMFHEESPLSYCRSTPPTGVRISRNAFFYISLRDPYTCTRRVKTLNRLRIVERKREREGERKEANTWAAQ